MREGEGVAWTNSSKLVQMPPQSQESQAYVIAGCRLYQKQKKFVKKQKNLGLKN